MLKRIKPVSVVAVGLSLMLVGSGFAQTNPLQGVWKVTEVTTTGPNASKRAAQPGFYILTGKHYSIVTVNSDQPRPDLPGHEHRHRRATAGQLGPVHGSVRDLRGKGLRGDIPRPRGQEPVGHEGRELQHLILQDRGQHVDPGEQGEPGRSRGQSDDQKGDSRGIEVARRRPGDSGSSEEPAFPGASVPRRRAQRATTRSRPSCLA